MKLLEFHHDNLEVKVEEGSADEVTVHLGDLVVVLTGDGRIAFTRGDRYDAYWFDKDLKKLYKKAEKKDREKKENEAKSPEPVWPY